MGCGPGCSDKWNPATKQAWRPPVGGWTVEVLPEDIPNSRLHEVWAKRRKVNHNSAKAAVQEVERFLKNNGVKVSRTNLREHATTLWRKKDPTRFASTVQSKENDIHAGLFKMAFSLAKEVVKSGVALVKGEAVVSGKVEVARRLTVCLGCEHFIEVSQRCDQCGCFIEYKKLLATADCPLGKW